MHDHINKLTALLEEAKRENKQLREALQAGEKEAASLRRMLEQQKRHLDELLRQLYGRKSEKLDPDQMVFDKLLLEVLDQCSAALDDETEAEPESETEAKPKKRYKKPHPGRQAFPEHLERVEIPVDIPEDEKVDPFTGQALVVVREERTEKLEVIPGSLRVNVYVRPVYAMPKGDGMVIADLPLFPLDKCMADNGFLADIAVKRFVDHQPYYRQQQSILREGVNLHRNQPCNWMNRLADDWLTPLYEELKKDVLRNEYIGFDDTPINLLVPGRGSVQQARMWICRSGIGPPHLFFRFSLTRKKEEAEKLLEGFSGYAQADAYSGHDRALSADDITELGCWAHARRYFERALKNHPTEAAKILGMIAALYRIEVATKDVDDDQRRLMRQSMAVPVIEQTFAYLKELARSVLPKSALGKAITYSLNQEQPLREYLNDGRLKIDNNLVENAIRPLALGRKNWLFAGSERGGRTAAIFMSLFGSCKALGVNPWVYMKDILDRICTHPADRMRDLLPGYWKPLEKNTQLGIPVYLNKEGDKL